MVKRTKKSANAKVRNATPNIVDGIKFLSKLESYCYKALKEAGIEAEYEPQSYVLLEPFKYNGESIRKMSYKPDFVGDGFIIECKGMMTETFPLRWKMFKWYLFRNKIEMDLYLPRNQKQVNEVIQQIKDKINGIENLLPA